MTQTSNACHLPCRCRAKQTRVCVCLCREDRIRNGAKKLSKARATTQQGRLDSFFTVSHTVSATTPAKKAVRLRTLILRSLYPDLVVRRKRKRLATKVSSVRTVLAMKALPKAKPVVARSKNPNSHASQSSSSDAIKSRSELEMR